MMMMMIIIMRKYDLSSKSSGSDRMRCLSLFFEKKENRYTVLMFECDIDLIVLIFILIDVILPYNNFS
jgi:hypothetical protein